MFELKAGTVFLIFLFATLAIKDDTPTIEKSAVIPMEEMHLYKKLDVIDYELDAFIKEIGDTRKEVIDTMRKLDTSKLLINPKI